LTDYTFKIKNFVIFFDPQRSINEHASCQELRFLMDRAQFTHKHKATVSRRIWTFVPW